MPPLEGEESRPMSAEAQHVYVYGIARAEAGGTKAGVPLLEGIAGNSVRILDGDGLAALVSSLAIPAGGPTFDEQLKDPEQTKSLILDHHRVLQCLLDHRTVLPLRFGTLFSDDEKVRAALREHRRAFLEAIERVEGAREWGVKIFCDCQVLRRHLGKKSPAMREAQSELAGATQGRAFFLQRRVAALGEAEIERAVAQHVTDSRRRLGEIARAEASLKFQPAAVHGRPDDMVWNGAFLVATLAEQRFFAQIEELQQALEPCGFHYENNGPWPPFSFADYRQEE